MSSIVDGLFGGGDAAGDDADVQAQASQAAIEEQQRQFDILQANLSPYMQAGLPALSQYQALLGLGGGAPAGAAPAAAPTAAPISPTQGAIQGGLDFNSALEYFLTPEGGFEGDKAGAFQASQDYISGGAVAGASTTGQLQPKGAGVPPPVQRPGQSALEAQQSAFASVQESPGQQFIRQRAQRNRLQNASAIGGLGGGNVRTALTQQGAGFASQDLQNRYARLQNLISGGQASAAGVGQAGQQMASNVGNLLQSGAQAQATGIAGVYRPSCPKQTPNSGG